MSFSQSSAIKDGIELAGGSASANALTLDEIELVSTAADVDMIAAAVARMKQQMVDDAHAHALVAATDDSTALVALESDAEVAKGKKGGGKKKSKKKKKAAKKKKKSKKKKSKKAKKKKGGKKKGGKKKGGKKKGASSSQFTWCGSDSVFTLNAMCIIDNLFQKSNRGIE